MFVVVTNQYYTQDTKDCLDPFRQIRNAFFLIRKVLHLSLEVELSLSCLCQKLTVFLIIVKGSFLLFSKLHN